VIRYFLDVAIVFAGTSVIHSAEYPENRLRREDKGQKLGYDAFHRIGYEYLIAIELYFIFLQVEVTLYAREIKNSG